MNVNSLLDRRSPVKVQTPAAPRHGRNDWRSRAGWKLHYEHGEDLALLGLNHVRRLNPAQEAGYQAAKAEFELWADACRHGYDDDFWAAELGRRLCRAMDRHMAAQRGQAVVS